MSVSLQGRHQATQGLLLEAFVSHINRRDGEEGATTRGRSEPLYLDFSTGHWAGGFGHSQDWRSRRIAAKIAGTAMLATHTVKVGAEYEDNRLDQHWLTTHPGIILVPTPPSTEYWSIYLDWSGRVANRVLTLFAQDSWLMTKWLRLNLGLRWERQDVVGADGRTARAITSQVQPRVGLVAHWGAQTASFSYARYDEQLGTAFAVYNHCCNSQGSVTYIYDEDPASGAGPRDSLYDPPPTDPIESPNLRGPHVHEWTAGYTRLVGKALRIGLRAVHRDLGEAIDNGAPAPFAPGFTGNPGRGDLAFLPRFERNYSALEFTLGVRLGQRAEFSGSYVLSRSWGNYPGLYDSDIEGANPHSNLILDFPEQVPNSWGRLPNDRTHVFKLFGSARLTRDLTAGVFAAWQSGTPLNELGAIHQLPAFDIFLRPRGSAGRGPDLWDLSFRGTYVIPIQLGRIVPRLVLDVLQVGSPRRAVSFDQVHFQDADQSGNQILPNPNYLRPTRYQPPMNARFGLIVDF
jgi:outer membrane receptor protein involved in Fe transport